MAISINGFSFEGPYMSMAGLRHEQAIYVILDKEWDGRWSVVDVGESEDVATRVENHERKDCWQRNRKGQLGVAVLYTPGWPGHQRRAVESQIRDAYAPPCGIC